MKKSTIDRKKAEFSKQLALDQAVPFVETQMKYSHLIEEPLNEGKSYREYREANKRKMEPVKKERLQKLRAERAERIKLKGAVKFNGGKSWSNFQASTRYTTSTQ